VKLTAVNRRKQRFPDATTSPFVEMVFEQDGEIVRKHIRISTCARAVSTEIKREAKYLFMKTALEAKRDFAYLKGGMEAVRQLPRNLDDFEGKELFAKAEELLAE
jgi:hypothetical protein